MNVSGQPASDKQTVPQAAIIEPGTPRYVDTYSSRHSDVDVMHRQWCDTSVHMMRNYQPVGIFGSAAADEVVLTMTMTPVRGVLDLGGGRIEGLYPRNTCAVVLPGLEASFDLASPTETLAIALPIDRLRLKHATSDNNPLTVLSSLRHRTLQDPMISSILLELWQELEASRPYGALFSDAAIDLLAIQILRSATRVTPMPAKGGLSPSQLRCLQSRLMDDLSEDVTLSDLASLIGLSTFHLCRAFKQATGMPPHRWRLAQRIERAREMLERTDMPVTDIAASIGYDDPSQLSAAFRKIHGASPSQYRRERRF